MKKTYGIVANLSKDNALSAVKKIARYLSKKKQLVIVEESVCSQLSHSGLSGVPLEQMLKKASLIIALGGDGTILHLVRSMKSHTIPVLGVNLGGLGFLTEVKLKELNQALSQMISGRYVVDKRMMFEASIRRKKKIISRFQALNDVVVTNGSMARVIYLDVMIGLESVNSYVSDGLIVSTPTGSTAYSLSSGGPILHPSAEAMLMTPISPHTLSNRPMVVPANQVLKIRIGKTIDDVVLTIDGQMSCVLKCDDVVEVKKATAFAKLVMLGQNSYFGILREKLGWGALSPRRFKAC